MRYFNRLNLLYLGSACSSISLILEPSLLELLCAISFIAVILIIKVRDME